MYTSKLLKFEDNFVCVLSKLFQTNITNIWLSFDKRQKPKTLAAILMCPFQLAFHKISIIVLASRASRHHFDAQEKTLTPQKRDGTQGNGTEHLLEALLRAISLTLKPFFWLTLCCVHHVIIKVLYQHNNHLCRSSVRP